MISDFEKRFLPALLAITGFLFIMSCVMPEASFRDHWMTGQPGLMSVATACFLLVAAGLCGCRSVASTAGRERRDRGGMDQPSGRFQVGTVPVGALAFAALLTAAAFAELGSGERSGVLTMRNLCLTLYLALAVLPGGVRRQPRQVLERLGLPLPARYHAAIALATGAVVQLTPAPCRDGVLAFLLAGLVLAMCWNSLAAARWRFGRGGSGIEEFASDSPTVLSLDRFRPVPLEGRRAA